MFNGRDSSVSIELEGFAEAVGFVNIFKSTAMAIVREETADLARWMAEEVQMRIRTQKYRHTALRPGTVRAKEKAGLDPRILIATGEYAGSIQAIPVTKGMLGSMLDRQTIVTWSVGVPDQNHSSANIPLQQLAKIHEFGSKKNRIPARPHWRPVWSIVVSRKKKAIGKKIMAKTKKAARAKANRSTGNRESKLSPAALRTMVTNEVTKQAKSIAKSLAKEMKRSGKI